MDEVLNAALAVGLDGMTMAAVADRLGVRITVLYGYVASRAELVRLASAHAAQDYAFPIDTGQHWATYVAEHARALFSLFTGPGQLIARYVVGGLSPETEIDSTEAWLRALCRQGFEARTALFLQRQVGEIVLGGAVTALHLQALDARGTPFDQAARRALAAPGISELPLLKSHVELFATRPPVWQRSVMELLVSHADEQGETLDISALRRIFEGP